ncbi:sensor histidine kinase [Sedimenticola sp.]|uniref:sensor histidine kinase n=1 Tax=Sedimenticola sp. TaxID=1940285 RepID=UPI003D0D803C
MLQQVAEHGERDWFQLNEELRQLPAQQQKQVCGRIARDMGQRSGIAPLGYPIVVLIMIVISVDIREHLDWLWLPALTLMLSGSAEFYVARQLSVAADEAIDNLKWWYHSLSLISALSWGMFTGLIILTHEGNPVSMLVFLCTVAATSISVGTQTQEKRQWLDFLAMMWTPIAASAALVAGIHKETEVLLFAMLAVAFPVLVGVQGLRLVAEYLEAQLDRSALEVRSLDLEEALIKRQLAEKARKSMEVQLRQAQKLESIGQLAAGIAHEINTPVQFVGDNNRFLQEAFADMAALYQAEQQLRERSPEGQVDLARLTALEQEYDLDYLMEEIPKSLKQSEEGLTRIARIISAMKEFSHPGSRDKGLVDVNKVITTTLEVSRNEWKYVADLECDLDADLPSVPGYVQGLNQVFLNMIVNAAHAIGERLDETAGSKGKIDIRTRRQGEWLEVTVGDNGVGIPKGIINRVFDPFFTTKEVGKGSGQGLAIAYSVVVDKHGGTIAVESEPGVGTTFTIRLPLKDPNMEQ